MYISFIIENYFKSSLRVTHRCHGTLNIDAPRVSGVTLNEVPAAQDMQPHLFLHCLYVGSWVAYTAKNVKRLEATQR